MSRAGRALVLALALAGCEAEPDHRGPVIAGGDAAVQGAAVQDAAVQDAAVQDAAVQDAAVQDAAVQDAAVQDAAVRDAAVPEAAVPDAVALDLAPADADATDARPPDALPLDLCAQQPDFEACHAVGCRWTGDGACRFVEQAPPCTELDPFLCAERLDCAVLGDRCLRTLQAPCVVLDPLRCAVRPEACRWQGGRCAPADPVGDPCAAVPFPACPMTRGCTWAPEPCPDCPDPSRAQPWPTGRCLDGDLGPCAGLAAEACVADPACVWDAALPRCLTRAQHCGQGDVVTCFDRGCFMVRYRLCEPVSRPDGSPDPDECAWREAFVCEDL